MDGSHAVRCWNASVSFKEVRRFLRMARWVYKARVIETYYNGDDSVNLIAMVSKYPKQEMP